jgi:ABC-type transporter Mla subunit MlaD
MSLGPPFDASGLRTQQWVGAVVVLVLAAASAYVLFLSERTLGRGVTFHLALRTAGPLRTGARVMLAGRTVGEVRDVETVRDDDGTLRADFAVFIARDAATHVRRNSQLFVSTPSVLGEAYLEIGPPPRGEEPGPRIGEGDRVRGADPPDLDQFFVKAEASIREVMALLEEQRPELDELLTAGDSLLATLSGLPADRGQLRRIVDQGAAALDAGHSLLTTVREAGGVERMQRIGRELVAIVDRAAPDLEKLGVRLDRALERLDGMKDLFAPHERAQVEAALAHLRRAVELGERIVADVRVLVEKVKAGQGTIGAFLADREIFDDFHETHRIIKSQPLRFLLKTVKPGDKLGP